MHPCVLGEGGVVRCNLIPHIEPYAVLCLVAQLHLTCSPVDCSLPGSFVHEIFQARILEWGTISYSRGSSQSRDGTCVSVVSCIVRQILYHWEAPDFMNNIGNMTRTDYQNEK